jgi:uncharacterized membrane protein YqhA
MTSLKNLKNRLQIGIFTLFVWGVQFEMVYAQNRSDALIDDTVNLDDPDLGDVGLLILSVTRFIIATIGGVAIFMIMFGGFQYASGFAQGKDDNPEALSTIQNAVLGLIIVMVAYIGVSFVQSALTTNF